MTRLRKKLENLAIAIKTRNINDAHKYAKNTILILAGISISMLMGQNGILNRAAESKREHTVAQEREAIAIAYSASMNVDNIGKVTGLELQNELDKIMKNTAVTENDTDLNILFKDTLHRYTISQDGTITKKDDLTPEEANKIVRILSSNMVLTADGTVKYIGNESLNTTDCTKLNTSDAKIITNNGIIKSAEGDILLIIKESCS